MEPSNGTKQQNKGANPMCVYIGIDWSQDKHDVVIVREDGRRLLQFVRICPKFCVRRTIFEAHRSQRLA